MINRKQIVINGKMYDVVTLEEYSRQPDAYLSGYTAVDIGNWSPYVYPIVPYTSNEPGLIFRSASPIQYTREPSTEMAEHYRKENIIDYSKAETFRDFVATHSMVRELEKDIITSPDNIYVPPENENDTPAMKALKEAVVAKHIDLDKYEYRFGSNYNNDKRIFNKNSISLPMLVRMCNNLDIKATLTLEDQPTEEGDTPNPINNKITVELTSGSYSGEE